MQCSLFRASHKAVKGRGPYWSTSGKIVIEAKNTIYLSTAVDRASNVGDHRTNEFPAWNIEVSVESRTSSSPVVHILFGF